MRFAVRVVPARDLCDERRPRRHGYQLRCLEPAGHDGVHRWTPELLSAPARRDGTRPPVRPIRRVTAAAVGRLARMLD